MCNHISSPIFFHTEMVVLELSHVFVSAHDKSSQIYYRNLMVAFHSSIEYYTVLDQDISFYLSR